MSTSTKQLTEHIFSKYNEMPTIKKCGYLAKSVVNICIDLRGWMHTTSLSSATTKNNLSFTHKAISFLFHMEQNPDILVEYANAAILTGLILYDGFSHVYNTLSSLAEPYSKGFGNEQGVFGLSEETANSTTQYTNVYDNYDEMAMNVFPDVSINDSLHSAL